MLSKNDSLFRLISVGTVASNKARGSIEVDVYLRERTSVLDGELSSQVEERTHKGVDASGVEYTTVVTCSNTVTAQWKGSGGNRVTAPDVRRGDEIDIFQYGDVDQYFWALRSSPDHTARKLETVVNAYNASPDEDDNTPSEENSYTTQISTHDQHLTIKTTKANGEPFAYTIQVNTKDGIALIADDAGLYIQAESAEKRIILDNGGGSKYTMHKAKTLLETDEFEVLAKNKINFVTEHFNVVATTHTTFKTHFKVNDGIMDVNDSTKLQGGLNSSGGKQNFAGPFSATGGGFTHMGVNVGFGHGHTGVMSGPSVSGPPVG